MKHCIQQLETETFFAQREWTAEGIPVLCAEISLPRPIAPDNRISRRIHRFYQLQGHSYLRYCEHWLAPKAAADCRQALMDSTPLPQYTARLTCHITCNEAGIFSLYTDTQEFTGGPTLMLRRSDTWDLRTGYPLPVSAFFPKQARIRSLLLQTAAAEIRRQEEAGTAAYAPSWPQTMKRTFNRNHFYITPDAFCFFWQMYAIAPSTEGFPTFSIPFRENICLSPFLFGKQYQAPDPAPDTSIDG